MSTRILAAGCTTSSSFMSVAPSLEMVTPCAANALDLSPGFRLESCCCSSCAPYWIAAAVANCQNLDFGRPQVRHDLNMISRGMCGWTAGPDNAAHHLAACLLR